MKRSILAAALMTLGLLALHSAHSEDKPKKETAVREFTLVAVQIEQAKFWLPSLLVAKKGDRVKITLKNMIRGDAAKPDTLIHGFALDEFDVVKVVELGDNDTVEFTADKAGLFRLYCQLHPAHIGGQLLVLEK